MLGALYFYYGIVLPCTAVTSI